MKGNMTIADIHAVAEKYMKTDSFGKMDVKISSKPDIVDREQAKAEEIIKKLDKILYN